MPSFNEEAFRLLYHYKKLFFLCPNCLLQRTCDRSEAIL